GYEGSGGSSHVRHRVIANINVVPVAVVLGGGFAQFSGTQGRSVIANRIILAVKFGGGTGYSRGGTTAWLTGAQRDDIESLGFHVVDVADDIHDLKSGDCRKTHGGKFIRG